MLVVASEVPDGGTPGEAWLLALLALRPWARVTLVGERGDGAPWLARGVEVLTGPVADVLRRRCFDYDAVFADGARSVPEALVDEYQLQAARFGSMPVQLEVSLASAGLVYV